jgi:hypothetical protein
MVEPPLEKGIDHDTIAEALAGTAVGLRGALGTVDVSATVEAMLVPAGLVAVTLNE